MAEKFCFGQGLYVQLSKYRGTTYVHISGRNGRSATISAHECLDLVQMYDLLEVLKRRVVQEATAAAGAEVPRLEVKNMELRTPNTASVAVVKVPGGGVTPDMVLPPVPVPQLLAPAPANMKRKRSDESCEEPQVKKMKVESPEKMRVLTSDYQQIELDEDVLKALLASFDL